MFGFDKSASCVPLKHEANQHTATYHSAHEVGGHAPSDGVPRGELDRDGQPGVVEVRHRRLLVRHQLLLEGGQPCQ